MSLYGIIRDPKTDIDVLRANERVNNMSEQQFEDHMNELFLRDNKKPIKYDVLSQLPKSKYRKNKGHEGSKAVSKDANRSEHQCSICMSQYEDGDDILTLTCFHKFHNECVVTWFKT